MLYACEPSTEAADGAQGALGEPAEARTCDPPVENFDQAGKNCPKDSDPTTCLNGNHAYATFAEAWEACGADAGCGLIMKYDGNGKYYMRRSSDPDTSHSSSMLYACEPSTEAADGAQGALGEPAEA